MTSHSPSFFFFFFSSRLLPLLVLETVGRMSRHHGVSTYTMLASVVAGREGGLGWGSLHRHDVLDESCNGRDDEEGEWVMKKSKSEHMIQQEVKEIKVMLRHTDFCPNNNNNDKKRQEVIQNLAVSLLVMH